jgi:hypothetical protein
MKINRADLVNYLKRIRRKAGSEELNDEKLIDELANYMEANPACIDLVGISHPGRFSYSTVGYGVFSLMGEKYRMGRVEIFDRKEDSGYAVDEGTYCMPFLAANQFEDFIESLETDLPIEIKIGSYENCKIECAKELGFDNPDDMSKQEVIKAYYKAQNDKMAQTKGYIDFEDMMQKNPLFSKKKEQ